MNRRRWLLLGLLLFGPPLLGWPVLRSVLWLPTAGGFQLTPSPERRYGEQARRELAGMPGRERVLGLVECLTLEGSRTVLEQAVRRHPSDVPLRAALAGRYLGLGVARCRGPLRETLAAGRRLDPDNAYFDYLAAWVEAVPEERPDKRTGGIVGPRLDRARALVERGNRRKRYDSYRPLSREALFRELQGFGMPALEARVTAETALRHPEMVDLGRLGGALDAHARHLEGQGEIARACRIWRTLAGMGRMLEKWEPYLNARGMAHHVLGNALLQLARHASPERAAALREQQQALVGLSGRWRRNLEDRPDYLKSDVARGVIVSYTSLGAPLLLALLAALLLLATRRAGRCEHPLSRRERLRILLLAVVLPAAAQLVYLLLFSELRLSSGRRLLYLQLLNFAWAWCALLLLLVLVRVRTGGGRWGRSTLGLLLLVAGVLLVFSHGIEYSSSRLRWLYASQALVVVGVVVLAYLHSAHPGDSQPLLLLRHQRPLWGATLVICLVLFYLCVGLIHFRRERLEGEIRRYQHRPGGYLISDRAGG